MKYSSSLPLVLILLALTAARSPAAVLYSGLQNITVTSSFTSVYVDVDQFAGGSAQTTGWDIDAFFGGEAFGNSANFQPVRQTVDVNSAIVRLLPGDVVDGSDIYATAQAGSSTHMGNSPGQFASGVEGYFGFRLIDNNAAGPFHGWMRVNLSNTGGVGSLIDWAYDNTGAAIAVGAIPEPTFVTLLGLGAMALVFRRRKS